MLAVSKFSKWLTCYCHQEISRQTVKNGTNSGINDRYIVSQQQFNLND